jgi:tetratricopeptide (TPR) repeat protein
VNAGDTMPLAKIALERGDPAAAERISRELAEQLRALKPNNDQEMAQASISLYSVGDISAQAAYHRGDFAKAEKDELEALAARKIWGTTATPDQRDIAASSTWLAMSVSRQGRAAEALQIIAPVVKLERELTARNHGDQWVPYELAFALYAQSLCDPQHAPALLREATGLLNGLGAELKPLRMIRELREYIRQAERRAS